ncbi:MAG: TonB-dependent receptor [Bacteroidetes bacterium]|nr:MAG: TonB-dependent receptor [Bacteroidota bacterium]
MAIRIFLIFTFFFPGAVCLLVAQNPVQQPIDFVCQNCLPADALVQLSRETGINIVFNDRFFQDCPSITIAARQQPFSTVLEQIASCSQASYKWVAGQVVFYRKARRFTLSGYVQDAETGERLIGASVRIISTSTKGTITNEFGFYSIPLDEGTYQVAVHYIGYQQEVRQINMDQVQLLTFRLKANTALPEVVITALPLSESLVSSEENRQNLPAALLEGIPMPGGEADLIRLAALQPGVQTGVDGLGGLHVRGGNADQNLILLDDVPVYNPNHALGLFSVFNPATIKNARLWKGDFPARYGGRASSVLDVRTRDGNFRENHSSLSVGLFASSATLEGPIKRDTSSFLLSGRTTYFGPWIDLFSKRENLLTFSGDQVTYRFYDVNLKLNYIFSPKNRLYFSYYQGGDVFRNQFEQRFDDPEGLYTDQYGLTSDWGNAIAALRWNHLLRKNLFTNTTLRFSRFYYQSRLTLLSTFLSASGKESLLANYGQIYQTLIQDWSGKTDFSYFPKNWLTLRWGIAYTLHSFQPGALSVNFLVPGQSPITIDSLSLALLNDERLGADEAEMYVDSEWKLWKHWRLESGLNFSSFQIRNSRFSALQPRIRLQRSGKKGWRFWWGYHRNAQYLHQIGSFNISLPFELWVPTTLKVPPEKAWQVSTGLALLRNGWHFQLEGYYKRLDRVLTFLSSNTALFTGGAEDASGWEDRILSGKGRTYGLEMTLQKRTRTNTATLSYTWSDAQRQFPDLNTGKPFPFRFDRRHDLKISVQQRIASWLNAELIWAFATGNPITLSGVKFQHHTPNGDTERNVYVYTEVNGYRLPAYHRLDAALNAYFGGGNWKHAIHLGVYNAYNRANPFFLYVDSGSGSNAKAIQYTLLPLLPSFRYELKF